jgi:hypothetical protein
VASFNMLTGNNALFATLLAYAASECTAAHLSNRNANCRSVPGSPNWPTEEVWRSFNETLQGALLAPLPPAIACDVSQKSYYDNATCSLVGLEWFNSSFHASDPVSVDWPNWQADACLPTAVIKTATDCNTTPFPHYVVNASEASHVAATVKFAAKHKVRFSVKGTGHDFLGR